MSHYKVNKFELIPTLSHPLILILFQLKNQWDYTRLTKHIWYLFPQNERDKLQNFVSKL